MKTGIVGDAVPNTELFSRVKESNYQGQVKAVSLPEKVDCATKS